MRWMWCIALCLLWTISLAGTNPVIPVGVKPSLLVPLYVYPHGWGTNEYKRLIDLQKRHPKLRIIAILNVDFDSRDWKTDPSYSKRMQNIAQDLDAVGIVVIGYASSSYSRRPFQGDPKGSGFGSDFKTNVDRWIKYFPRIRGIFVDEMCYSATLYEGLEHPCLAVRESKALQVSSGTHSYKDILSYYRNLYSYIRQTKGLEVAITNPGHPVTANFFDGSVADAIVIYEGSEAHFDPTIYPFGSNPSMTGILLYNDPPPFALDKLKAIVGKVSLVYITDTMYINNVLNPWSALPRYLEDLANYLDSP